MINKLFAHTDLMTKSLDASWLRKEVIAQNVANADTPGYKSKRVEFEAEFRAALTRSPDRFKAKRTRARHIEFGRETDPLSVRPVIAENNHYTMKMDGNNVDIDHEMTEEAKNTILYETLVTKVSREMARLKTAIRDVR